MSKIRVIICRVDDEDAEKMTEIGSYDLAEIGLGAGNNERTLDEIEQRTYEKGNVILKGLVQAQWAEIDQELARAYRQHFPPSGSNA
ncbi:MAG: hypothetical protein R2911_20390 [Caldilineaceae bacterium]